MQFDTIQPGGNGDFSLEELAQDSSMCCKKNYQNIEK
jgi:hypothetical protein